MILDKVKTSKKIQDTPQDMLPGRKLLESDVYGATLGVCYLRESPKGAVGMTITAKINKQDYEETIYFTNREGEDYYTRNNKDYPLPGKSKLNSLCMLATGKGLLEQSTDVRHLTLYEKGKKVENKPVEILPDLKGKQLIFGIVKVKENKTKRVNEKYRLTDEVREYNEIDTIANKDMFTYAELAAGIKEPAFLQKWLKANKEKIRDNYKEPEIKSNGSGADSMSATGAMDNSPPIDFD